MIRTIHSASLRSSPENVRSTMCSPMYVVIRWVKTKKIHDYLEEDVKDAVAQCKKMCPQPSTVLRTPCIRCTLSPWSSRKGRHAIVVVSHDESWRAWDFLRLAQPACFAGIALPSRPLSSTSNQTRSSRVPSFLLDAHSFWVQDVASSVSLAVAHPCPPRPKSPLG